MVKDRRRKVDVILQQHGLDALLLTNMNQIRYLTGFTGTEALLLVSTAAAWFPCDSRYTSQASEQVDAEVVEFKQKWPELCGLIRQQGLVKVGFEAAVVSYSDHRQLSELGTQDISWLPVSDLANLRLVKDVDELSRLERATRLSADAFEEIAPQIKPGVTEKTLALELEMAIRRLGGDEKSFDFIVASGPRGALPHGVASDRVLADNELVTIDFGGRTGGYYSDETVTVALGEPEEELRTVFDVVLEAHDRAIAMIRPGVSLREIDAAAREFIVARGYGDYFGHGLGHGVGLEVHEAPRVSTQSKGLTETGMVFTVEPGIYIPGKGGVRIEDMVVVTEDGCRILTHLPKSYRRLN